MAKITKVLGCTRKVNSAFPPYISNLPDIFFLFGSLLLNSRFEVILII